MASAEAVLAECLARPDDDAPRLVYADLIGGPRGEFIVLQCDLARGEVTPARRARERELVDEFGQTWAGAIAKRGVRWQFHRGFVDAIRIDGRAHFPFADAPFLTAVTIADDVEDPKAVDRVLADVPNLRALALPGALWARGNNNEALAKLRGLSLSGIANTPALRYLASRAKLERLALPGHQLEPQWLDEILAAAPGLIALDAGSPKSVEPLVRHPLVKLRTTCDVYELGRRAPGTLEFLSLPEGDDLPDLPGFANLRIVELGDARSLLAYRAANPHAFPKLHTIRSVHVPSDATETVGEQELFRDARAMGLARETCCLHAPGFTLAGDRVYRVAKFPADRRISVGGGDCDVNIDTNGWGPQCIDITWTADGVYAARNRGPRIDGLRIDGNLRSHGPLTEGCKITIGGTVLAFSSG